MFTLAVSNDKKKIFSIGKNGELGCGGPFNSAALINFLGNIDLLFNQQNDLFQELKN